MSFDAFDAPWHAVGQTVYHDHRQCRAGWRAVAAGSQSGTGGKPHCDECQRLQQGIATEKPVGIFRLSAVR